MRFSILWGGFLFAAASCGVEEKDHGPYMRVGGYYCAEVAEIENTCACGNEPRNLESPTLMLYQQVVDTAGNGTPRVTVIGGGLEFPGTLDSEGYLRANAGTFDQNIERITYTGKFTGTSGVASYHETIGPDDAGTICPTAGISCHMRIEYENYACCGGNGGYNVITLAGEKLVSDAICPSGFSGPAVRFSAWP